MFLMPIYIVFCKKKCTWPNLLAIEIIQGLIMCVFCIRQFMVLSKPQALGLIALTLSCSILGFMFLGLIVTCLSSFTLLVWFIFFSMLIIPSLLAAILPLFQTLLISSLQLLLLRILDHRVIFLFCSLSILLLVSLIISQSMLKIFSSSSICLIVNHAPI